MKAITIHNLFANLPASPYREHFQTLLETGDFRVERIVSNGQASPKDFWYDQEQNEWVLLLRGTARLRFQDDSLVDLRAGDFLLLQSHIKHRVEQTSSDALWLAMYYQ